MSAGLAQSVISKKEAKFQFSIFKKYWQFLTLFCSIVSDSLQHVKKLLKRLKKESFGAATILVLEVKAMETEIAEEKEEEKKYQAVALIEIVVLEEKSNIQTMFRYIKSNWRLDTH